MKTFLDCIPCLMKQALQTVRQVTENEKVWEEVLRSALFLASKMDYTKPPAMIGREIHSEIRKLTSDRDPYAKIKEKANQVALKLKPRLREEIKKSEDPFDLAIRYAIAGNILDFALYSGWDDERFLNSLNTAHKKQLDRQQLEMLRKKVNQSDKILYIADNAGETVFDSLLIEQLHPKEIIYAVKGYPIINDALMEDALIAGIDKYATIIDNGTDAAGTILSLCSRYFMQVFDNADIVIAKGQANFETLNDSYREVYFLTQIKCSIIARDLKGNVGDWVITSSQKHQNTISLEAI